MIQRNISHQTHLCIEKTPDQALLGIVALFVHTFPLPNLVYHINFGFFIEKC